MSQLTSRQREILAFIQDAVREEGYPPAQRDIAQHFGFGQNAARDHLLALARKGEIELVPNDARGIRLLKPVAAPQGLPLLGRIAAGAPVTAPEQAEDWIDLPVSLFASKPDFLHRVDGDSMIDAGILPGDLVALRQQAQARNGEIVAACLLDAGDDFERITLKRYQRDGDRIALIAENARYAPIEIDLRRAEESQEQPGFRIAGVMVGLVRPNAG